ncbi:MAG: Zn-dependent exopeptidase M28 [Acidobacteria bacterium]|nr:Zn-dependent exopeptidase M28 [Acidobacteriota bacterium]
MRKSLNFLFNISLIFFIFAVSNLSLAQNKPLHQEPKPELPEEKNLSSIKFDSKRAFEHVRKQVEFGPRCAGSPALKNTRTYLINQLSSYGLSVKQDSFQAHTPNPRFPTVEMVNLIVEIPGKKDGIVILASHYDTKWFAEEHFLGANDGGSSTGVLVELARTLSKSKPEYTLWLVFFDGEEAMNGEWLGTDHTYGSTHLVNKLRTEGNLNKVKAMILLDMIGDMNLTVRRDSGSTLWLKDIIWNSAAKLSYDKNFVNEIEDIEDDHTPFLRAGIPAVDIIDFEYGEDNEYWHTEEDTLDKISPKSLQIVGETVLHSLPKIFNHLSSTPKL